MSAPIDAPVDPAASLPRVAVSMTPRQRFEEYLQTRGLRQTAQRNALIDQVFAQHGHFDADELIERMPKKGEPGYVSPATVYRTLKEFVEAGLLNSFQLDGRAIFEFDYGYPTHDHLYCTTCRTLVEFQSEEMMRLRAATAADHGFRVSRHQLLIQGTCRSCLDAKRKRRKQDLV